jgi:hypothetical protein
MSVRLDKLRELIVKCSTNTINENDRMDIIIILGDMLRSRERRAGNKAEINVEPDGVPE